MSFILPLSDLTVDSNGFWRYSSFQDVLFAVSKSNLEYKKF